MSDLRKVDHQDLRDVIGTFASGKAGLAEGTNSATIKTTSTISFSIAGILYSLAATDNIAVTATGVQAISTTLLYLVCVNAAGAVLTVVGTATDLPAVPSGYCPIGAFKIVTDASHTFTPGTTDMSAAGITATFVDLRMATVSAPL